MLRESLLTLTLVATILAGCIQPTTETASVETLASEAQAPGWYTVDATASPEASLGAFWWTVPEGARVPSPHWPDTKVVPLEAALLLPENASLTEWALLAFHEDDDELVPLGGYISSPYDVRFGGTLYGDETVHEEAEDDPVFMPLWADEIEEGDRVGFVLAARSPEATTLQLAFRVLEKAPDHEEEPSKDAKRFLAEVEGLASAALPAHATGSGYQLAGYSSYAGFFLGSFRYELRTGPVEVQDVRSPESAAPFAQRATTIGAAFDQGGWGEQFGFFSADVAAGAWEVTGRSHAEEITVGGRVVDTPAGSAWPVSALPVYMASGEGEEGAASELRLDLIGSGGQYEFLGFFQLDLGATLTSLFGLGVEPHLYQGQGLIDEAARIDARGGDLRISLPTGATYTLAGHAPPRAEG